MTVKTPQKKTVKPKAAEPKWDLKAWPLKDLVALDAELKTELSRRKKEAKKTLMQEMKVRAKSLGLNMNEVMSVGHRGDRPVKFRNPENPKETWGGQGKRPNWLKAALASGKTLQDLLAKE